VAPPLLLPVPVLDPEQAMFTVTTAELKHIMANATRKHFIVRSLPA
jgi:hypothetical protein